MEFDYKQYFSALYSMLGLSERNTQSLSDVRRTRLKSLCENVMMVGDGDG